MSLPPAPKPPETKAQPMVAANRAEFEAALGKRMAAHDWAGALHDLQAAEPLLGSDARLHHQAGHILMKLGRALDAYGRFSAALKLMPLSVEVRLSIADAYLALQDRWSAAAWLSDALRVAPARSATWVALGQLLAQSERLEEWLQLAQTAVDQGVADQAMTSTLADELLRRRSFEPAAKVYSTLLAASPSAPVTDRARWHLHEGFCQEQLYALSACVAAYQEAAAVKPGFVEAHINLAGVLWRLGDFAGSLHHAQQAVQLAPEHPHAWRIQGTALLHVNRLAEAEPWLRGALQRHAHFPYATLDLALLKLLSGAWADGWALYRLRWQDVQRIPRPGFWRAELEWQGPVAQPVAGRTVLVYGEQGLGDMIQFVRYVARLIEDGATVCVVTTPTLTRVLQSFLLPPQSAARFRVVQAGDEIRFDWHVAMLDLPQHYAIDPSKEAPTPAYLSVQAEQFAQWQRKLQAESDPARPPERLKVGLCWAGAERHPNNVNRSMCLSLLEPIWAHPQVVCHSLQKVPSEAFADVPAQRLAEVGWVDHTANWADFADSAAYIQCLDLVITVDSAVAHLAAALGKPTWVLLPPNPDWRWQLHGEQSIWYQSMRLFRRAQALTPEAQIQPRRQQVAEVVQALDDFMAARLSSGANLE